MGQKVHPIGYRLGIYKTWDALWFADKNTRKYSEWLRDDILVRSLLHKKLRNNSVAKFVIRRTSDTMSIAIHTSRVAMVIGKGGADIATLSAELQKKLGYKVEIDVVEVHRPESNAAIIASSVAQQLEKRIAFKRAVKQAMSLCMRNGAKGVKIRCSGRLGGADIARSEWSMEGRIPLHTLRADIDYGVAEAFTSYGVVGVKVWVYHGDSANTTNS